jgi:hypothetical protein
MRMPSPAGRAGRPALGRRYRALAHTRYRPLRGLNQSSSPFHVGLFEFAPHPVDRKQSNHQIALCICHIHAAATRRRERNGNLPCRPADQRGSQTGSIRHRAGRAGCWIIPSRRSDRPREGRCCASLTPSSPRQGYVFRLTRSSSALAASAGGRLSLASINEYPQQRLDRASSFDAGHRRGATAVQVASMFNAFSSRVELFENGPLLLSAEDDDAAETATAFHEAGIEKTSAGLRMNFSKNPNGQRRGCNGCGGNVLGAPNRTKR